MQGFIIKTHKVRDEDLLVTIITDRNLEVLYRFYGARHSQINLGYKIDFETEQTLKSDISRLRDVIHLGYKWMLDKKRLSLWQQFLNLFYPHLKTSQELDSFYFHLINQAALSWEFQNPKRVAIEAYVKLLHFEGRLHHEMICFYCDIKVEGSVALLRAFLPSHPSCSHTFAISHEGIEYLFKSFSTLYLSDKEVDRLFSVLLEGI